MRSHGVVDLMRRVTVVLAGALAGLSSFAAAHEIPTDVRINAFVKPEGKREMEYEEFLRSGVQPV